MPRSAQPPTGPLAEAERLRAVRAAVRAGEHADELQRLVRLAARVLRVPLAMVSCVDADREVVQAAVGLPEPWASRGWAPLSHSLCAHVVRLDGPVVLFDARGDPAYREHAAVLEMGARAYAGFPLRQGEHTLGAFCAADVVVRRWSEDDLELLEDLAAVVAAELAVRSAAQEAEASREQVRLLTRRLHEQSRTDPLTGAADRRRFEERAADELARLERHPAPLAVTLVDVDRFERIRHIAGQRTGEAVLAEVAARVQVTLRRTDLLARVGDDEFAVLLPDTDAQSAERLAQRVRRAVAEDDIAGWWVTVSTGSADHRPGGGVQQLYDDAGAALRAAAAREREGGGTAGGDRGAGRPPA
ncbi:sensor domain-containing diguanylate cyclase [Kineococcus sp. SYSU DK005]|uniref:sensor domain-containing diguanylate cyclase n=1 Tax=Kineococcus sp. SYSU DK005 TaxID=3383126 RepID=UPI003D7D2441